MHFPFVEAFDYYHCEVYIEIFASKGIKNGVLPTKDFQYSKNFANISLTDMELL